VNISFIVIAAVTIMILFSGIIVIRHLLAGQRPYAKYHPVTRILAWIFIAFGAAHLLYMTTVLFAHVP